MSMRSLHIVLKATCMNIIHELKIVFKTYFIILFAIFSASCGQSRLVYEYTITTPWPKSYK